MRVMGVMGEPRYDTTMNCSHTPVCNMKNLVTENMIQQANNAKYVIVHYSGAPCRRRHVIKHYSPAAIITGLDAEQLSQELVCSCVHPKMCTNFGELTQASCTLKHMLAWNIVSHVQRHYTIIIEDDMIPGLAFHTDLAHYIRKLPPDWEFFNFGCARETRITRGPTFCSRGYALTRSAAQKLSMVRWAYDPADSVVLRETSKLNSFHMTLPLMHGSQLRTGPVPRGSDLCNRSSLTVAVAKRARQLQISRMKTILP